MEQLTLGVYVVRHDGADSADSPEDIGFIMEGCTVLQDVSDVVKGAWDDLQPKSDLPKAPKIHL